MERARNPTSIPSITSLRAQLGYVSCEKWGYDDFTTSTRQFLDRFTIEGWKGRLIHEWNSEKHQDLLKKMVISYLDDDGNGKRFWPDNEIGRLQYSTHQEKIRKKMQQLFWRLNLQWHKYQKGKENKSARIVDTGDGSGLSHEDPIDVDALEDSPQEAGSAEMPSSSNLTASLEFFNHPHHNNSSPIDLELFKAQQSLPNGREVDDRGLQTLETKAQGQRVFASMSSIVPVDDRQCAPYTHIAPEMRMLQQRITDGNGSSSRVLPAESASKALHSTVALKMADRITSSAVVRRQGITETGVQQPAITSQTPHTTSVQLSPLKAPYREINWQLKHQCNTWDRESSSTVRKVKEEDDKGPVDYSDTELEIAEVLSLMRAGNVGSLSKSSHNFSTDPKIQVLPSVEAETSFSVHPPGPRYGHRPVREPHNQARCPSNPPTEGPSGSEMTKPANDSRVPVNGRWSGVESNFLEQEPTKVVQLLCALISDNRPALASSQKQVVRATEPVMKTTSIPSITQLREKLDYGDRNLSRCKALYDSARTFPKSFKTSQGWAGSGLRDWEHEEQRNALMEMSQFYLKDRGHGQTFWPDDQKSPRANKLQYSTHGEEIKQTMQQYFWRLNLQRFRSEKYGKNKKNARLVNTGDGNGLSHEYPIDVDALEDRSRDANSAEMPNSSSSITSHEPAIHRQHIDSSLIDPELLKAQQNLPNERGVSAQGTGVTGDSLV
ncbi:hypothetical protein Landi51_13867 [Colletotrichum acutatum]